MHAQLIDLLRRLESLIRLGTVAEVDLSVSPPVCRVQTGELLTNWRPFVAQRAGSARTWHPPTAGEQVLLLSPSGDLSLAVVLPALYCDDHPAPADGATLHRTAYPDGAVIEYNPDTGALLATGIQTATIVAEVKVTLDTPVTDLTGDLNVAGMATIGASASVGAALTVAEGVSAGAKISAPAVKIGSIEFADHRHPTPEGTSGGPI